MKKRKYVTLQSKCTVDCSECNRIVLSVRGYIEGDGSFNPKIDGDIQFEGMKQDKDKHFSFLKKGKHYRITISEILK